MNTPATFLSLNPPATLTDIATLETALGISVPSSVAAAYLAFGNGGVLAEDQQFAHADEGRTVGDYLPLLSAPSGLSALTYTVSYRDEDDLPPYFVAFALLLGEDPVRYDSRTPDAPVSIYVRDTWFENLRPLDMSFDEFWSGITTDDGANG